MYGSKGSGGRGVYARRRLLAVVVVLILLALLVPRACQALFGSNEEAGQGQRSGTAGKAAGAQNDTADTAANADSGNADTGNAGESGTQDKPDMSDGSSDRGAPFVQDETGSGEAGEEAARDLGVMVANLAVIDGSEDFAASEDEGSAGSAQGPSETGSEQLISERKFAVAASPAPAQQPAPEPEPEPKPVPTSRSAPQAAAPAAGSARAPLGERIRDRADRRARAALAEPAALDEVGVPQVAVEPVAPVAAEPAAAVPAPAVPAPAAPVPAAPVAGDPTFAPAPAGGGLNGAPPLPAVRATLPAGPRISGIGPGTRGPAVF